MAEKQDADCTLLLDSSDFFDPPAWVPGRYLQFADFSSTDEQSTLWPVSLPAEMQEDIRLYIPQHQAPPVTTTLQMSVNRSRLLVAMSGVMTFLTILCFLTYCL